MISRRTIIAFSLMPMVSQANSPIEIELNPLVDNGNSVNLRVRVLHPQIKDNFIEKIIITSEKNPQLEVASFHLTPLSGKAEVATRIRLATSQKIFVSAFTNRGVEFKAIAETIVSLAACLEE